LLQVGDTNGAAAVLEENLPGVDYEIFSGDTMHVYGIQDSGLLTNLMVEHKIEVRSIRFHSMDLEEYFLNLMEGGKANV
jgi:ABC-2 type transport system ATP-binding protein